MFSFTCGCRIFFFLFLFSFFGIWATTKNQSQVKKCAKLINICINYFILVVSIVVISSILFAALGTSKIKTTLSVLSPASISLSESNFTYIVSTANSTSNGTLNATSNATTNSNNNSTGVNGTSPVTSNATNSTSQISFTAQITQETNSGYFNFQKSFFMFIGYFLLCVYLPTGIVFVPVGLISDFISRPKYV